MPVLCNDFDSYDDQKLNLVKRGVERIVPSTIIYHKDRRLNECCSEAEVEEWLSKKRRGEETRALITDKDASRGWEASSVLVIVLGRSGDGLENLVMRAVGYCALVVENFQHA